MTGTFDASYVTLHVRCSNKTAFHLYKNTLGYECALHLSTCTVAHCQRVVCMTWRNLHDMTLQPLAVAGMLTTRSLAQPSTLLHCAAPGSFSL